MAQPQKTEEKTKENDNTYPPQPLNKQPSYHQMISRATHDRLSELSRLDSRGTGRASFHAQTSNPKSDDKNKNNDRDRFYSVASTNPKHLKKIENKINAQYAHQKAKQNHKIKQYMDSQKDLFKAIETKTQDNDNENNNQLSPVPQHDSHDAQNGHTHTQFNYNNNTNNNINNTQNNNYNKSKHTNKQQHNQTTNTATSSAVIKRPRRRIGPHIINPCVPLPGYNTGPNKRKSKGGFNKIGRFFFGKKHTQNTKNNSDNNTAELMNSKSSEPKRVIFQLEDEKYELYPWLKPTKALGQGAYATVCEVRDTRTKHKYAIKKNRDVFNNVADARRILREIKLMIHMHHENVMGLIGCIPPERWDINTFDEVYLVMNKCDTTMKRVIRSRQTLTEEHIIFFAYQIARGLEYMH
eukprot:749523_1